MGLSLWHIVVVLMVVLILFGAGKLPNVMGDLAKGIKNFKEGLGDERKATASEGSNAVTREDGERSSKG